MNKKIGLTEVVLRDGQQSLIATRMKTSDMVPILPKLDKVGYSSLEVWGGATYDCCLRFLNENPWDRLKVFKKYLKNTKLQMLLRGKNLVGYKQFDDSIISLFNKNVFFFNASWVPCNQDITSLDIKKLLLSELKRSDL